MARIDITQAFINFMDRASIDPLGAFEELTLDDFGGLNGFDLDEPDTTSVTSTRIFGGQGNSSVEFRGFGFAPTSSFEDFAEALANGTSLGTLQSIEIRGDGSETLTLGLTSRMLTATVGDRQLEVQGNFPTVFADVLDLLDAVGEFGDEFEFVSEDEQTEYEAIIARYDISSFRLSDG
ncbi:hypothetical protein, partial [Sulfitobacter donghicola]